MFKEIRNRAQPCEVYLSRANRHIIGRLEVNSAKLHMKLNDIWELDIEIDKYLSPDKKNPYYSSIAQYMEIYIPNVGWFRINGEPEKHEEYETGKMYKTFTAYGYETQIQDINLSTFYINNGLPISMEMFEENLNALGIPMRNITFYISNPSDDPTSESYWGLGLMNILEHSYFSKKGWSIGHIDTGLKSLRGRRFEVDSQDAYSFLTQDVSQAYRCLFTFDRTNKKINAYQVENLGKSLNIEMSRRNLLNAVTITSSKEYAYTQFNVAGGNDETTISYVNFGSSSIENLSYFIDLQLSKKCSDKYKVYTAYKESRRDDYANTIKEWLSIKQQIDVLHQQLPIDECKTNWNALETDKLTEQKNLFQALLDTLIAVHTHDGILLIEGTPDYAVYMSIKDVILPEIQKVLDARAAGEEPETEDTDYTTNWSLYGIDELEIKKKNAENQIDVLTQKGYDHPWEEGSPSNENVHNQQYERYLEYKKNVVDITERLNLLTEQEDILKDQQTYIAAQRDAIVADVKITNPQFHFTEDELSDIETLTIPTDYTDNTIEFQSMDEIDDIIALSKELLKSAQDQLEKESRPQMRYAIDADNPYKISQYKAQMDNLEMGDFIYMELDREYKVKKEFLADENSNYITDESDNWIRTNVIVQDYKIKQRVVGITLELVNFNDNEIQIDFSDMTLFKGAASDYDYLLGSGKSSSPNSITKKVSTYQQSAMTGIAQQVLNNYLNSGGGVFGGGISGEDLQKITDALSGLIDGNLSLNELKVKLAQIDSLEANSAFVNYLQAQAIVAVSGDFQQLNAKIASIDNLLAGNISGEVGQIIHLTSENVSIDEAVIKNLIAAHILVSDLKAGTITLNDQMKIISENGLMIMDGQTLQILGRKSDDTEFVAIQLGYDATNKPSLIIRDESGAIMLDASGLHEAIIPDGLIKNDMIHSGTIAKDKLAFSAVEEDEDGNISVADVIMDGQSLKARLTTIKEEVDNGIPYSIVLSNEYKGIATTANRIPTSSTSFYCDVLVMRGNAEYTDFTIEPINSANGISVSVSGYRITFSVSTSTPIGADSGSFSIPVKIKGFTYNKTFSWSCAKIGADGESPLALYISSDNGDIFKNGEIETVLTAIVVRGSVNVTDEFDSNQFIWTRKSADSDDDILWNSRNAGGSKSISITSSDVFRRATFFCDLIDTTTRMSLLI